MDPLSLFWLILILLSFQPSAQRQIMLAQRRRALASLASERDATIVTLIHRQESLAFLGIPLARHIDIDDSESILRAIPSTPPVRPIEIILHTPGGSCWRPRRSPRPSLTTRGTCAQSCPTTP